MSAVVLVLVVFASDVTFASTAVGSTSLSGASFVDWAGRCCSDALVSSAAPELGSSGGVSTFVASSTATSFGPSSNAAAGLSGRAKAD